VDHVLLTTTKWDRLETPAVGFQRSSELEREQWERLLSGGAKLCRFDNTQDSAWNVVDTLLAIKPLDLEILRRDLDRIQKTMAILKARLARPKRAFFAFIFDFIKSKVRILMFLGYNQSHLSRTRRNDKFIHMFLMACSTIFGIAVPNPISSTYQTNPFLDAYCCCNSMIL